MAETQKFHFLKEIVTKTFSNYGKKKRATFINVKFFEQCRASVWSWPGGSKDRQSTGNDIHKLAGFVTFDDISVMKTRQFKRPHDKTKRQRTDGIQITIVEAWLEKNSHLAEYAKRYQRMAIHTWLDPSQDSLK